MQRASQVVRYLQARPTIRLSCCLKSLLIEGDDETISISFYFYPLRGVSLNFSLSSLQGAGTHRDHAAALREGAFEAPRQLFFQVSLAEIYREHG